MRCPGSSPPTISGRDPIFKSGLKKIMNRVPESAAAQHIETYNERKLSANNNQRRDCQGRFLGVRYLKRPILLISKKEKLGSYQIQVFSFLTNLTLTHFFFFLFRPSSLLLYSLMKLLRTFWFSKMNCLTTLEGNLGSR